jgi:glycine cleavage system H protein
MAELRFSPAHLWTRVEGEEAVVGVSDFLQDQLGDLTVVDLPDYGDILRQSRRMGRLESEEASAPLEAPVSGEVLDVNSEVLDSPDLVNTDPYGAGWLLRVKLEDPAELADLLSEDEYTDLTTEV